MLYLLAFAIVIMVCPHLDGKRTICATVPIATVFQLCLLIIFGCLGGVPLIEETTPTETSIQYDVSNVYPTNYGVLVSYRIGYNGGDSVFINWSDLKLNINPYVNDVKLKITKEYQSGSLSKSSSEETKEIYTLECKNQSQLSELLEMKSSTNGVDFV